MTVTITGVKELDAKLERMKQSVQTKVIKKAMTAGTKEVAKAIKRALPSSWKGAKKTIGQRVNRPGKGTFKGMMFAKAGAGVGMNKKRRGKMADKSKEKGRGDRAGVGIGVSNIMWFLEGTNKRYNGTKRARRGNRKKGISERRVLNGKTVRYTGFLNKSGIIPSAFRSSARLANSLIMAELKTGIMREAAK